MPAQQCFDLSRIAISLLTAGQRISIPQPPDRIH